MLPIVVYDIAKYIGIVCTSLSCTFSTIDIYKYPYLPQDKRMMNDNNYDDKKKARKKQ